MKDEAMIQLVASCTTRAHDRSVNRSFINSQQVVRPETV